jgi:hypothetical protein
MNPSRQVKEHSAFPPLEVLRTSRKSKVRLRLPSPASPSSEREACYTLAHTYIYNHTQRLTMQAECASIREGFFARECLYLK